MSVNRLQNESEVSYDMFRTYLSMGFGRSITELAKTYEVSRQHIYNLMKKYNWKERIEAHDKKILKQIREQHNQTFQNDALLRRENLVNAYSLLQSTFAKMLSYSEKYTSNTMEADEFLNKTEKLFAIIQRYERISQSCEKYLSKFGIDPFGQGEEILSETKSTENEIEEFNKENDDLIENNFKENNETIEKVSDLLLQKEENFELTEEELKEIETEVKNDYPYQNDKIGRRNYRNNLIMKKMKDKYSLEHG